jgi:hypothetical protein
MKTEERTLTLKREVFLPASEAVSAGIAVIGRLPDLSVPLERLLEDWVIRSPAIARVNLVAGDTTLRVLTEFNAQLASVLFKLIGVRLRLTAKNDEQRSMMDEVTRISSNNRDRLALLPQLSSEEPADIERRALMKGEFEVAQRRVSELLTKHDLLTKELFEEQMEFTRRCQEASSKLGTLTIPLIASTREELGLPFDAAAFADAVNQAQAAAAADLKAFVDDLRSVVADA